jgi:hypothetical protein
MKIGGEEERGYTPLSLSFLLSFCFFFIFVGLENLCGPPFDECNDQAYIDLGFRFRIQFLIDIFWKGIVWFEYNL